MTVMANPVRECADESAEAGAAPIDGSGKKTDLQQHLQSMFALLPQHHVLKEVVRLESAHPSKIRYLAVIACSGSQPDEEEACVLGFDVIGERTSLGLVLCIYAETDLSLDGDGGFSLTSDGKQHVFKPVSVHVLWAVLQSLHKACDRAQKYNHYPGGGTHRWVETYQITSDRSCLNEWHYLPDVESRRPSSPQDQKSDLERRIRSTLKEVMVSLDLDHVTSKEIRRRVEEVLDMDLSDHKSFIDEEILTILGQMDGASRIFDDVFLGSEWNASNLEELERNGIGHILNVTREIDNFFPDQFDYLNVRVYDDEATELLKHWDRTYKYIRQALDEGSKVLVHCKMGVSRSASVVVAYAMKAQHWDLKQAMRHVKERRACVQPNSSFMQQLEMYAGILDASRQRHNKLWRSRSETNLTAKPAQQKPVRRRLASQDKDSKQASIASNESSSAGSSLPTSPTGTSASPDAVDGIKEAKEKHLSVDTLDVLEGGERPKSWSPDDSLAEAYFPSSQQQQQADAADALPHPDSPSCNRSVSVSLRVPCSNGRTYSVSQNRAVQLDSTPPPPGRLKLVRSSTEHQAEADAFVQLEVAGESSTDPDEANTSLPRVGSVKDRIYELEASKAACGGPATSGAPSRSGLVLNLACQFGCLFDGFASPVDEAADASRRTAGRKGEKQPRSADVFSSNVDRVFEREERRQSEGSVHHLSTRESPIRQHSWGATDARSRAASSAPAANSGWMSSYSSDPSLPSIPSEDGHQANECNRGIVRMQREALERASSLIHQQRRSLPEDSNPPAAAAVGSSSSSGSVFSRSMSDSSPTEGSVMRLRRELEAKAPFPLTGSFAPPPLLAAALASVETSQSNRTSPTRPKPPTENLRKRSLSLERVTYPDPAGQDWSRAAQAAAEEVDLNVKKIVGFFETPNRPLRALSNPSPGERPIRCNPPTRLGQYVHRRNVPAARRPPVPEAAGQQVRSSMLGKERKLYGKTHPLDRLAPAARQKLAQPIYGTM